MNEENLGYRLWWRSLNAIGSAPEWQKKFRRWLTGQLFHLGKRLEGK